MSYDTLAVLYHQLSDLARIPQSILTQIGNYKNFQSSVSHFLGQAKSCEHNPQWNPLIIEVKRCREYFFNKRVNFSEKIE